MVWSDSAVAGPYQLSTANKFIKSNEQAENYRFEETGNIWLSIIFLIFLKAPRPYNPYHR